MKRDCSLPKRQWKWQFETLSRPSSGSDGENQGRWFSQHLIIAFQVPASYNNVWACNLTRFRFGWPVIIIESQLIHSSVTLYSFFDNYMNCISFLHNDTKVYVICVCVGARPCVGHTVADCFHETGLEHGTLGAGTTAKLPILGVNIVHQKASQHPSTRPRTDGVHRWVHHLSLYS